MAVKGFAGTFLAMVHQGRKGSFSGEAEGEARIAELLASSDFTQAEGVLCFIEKVLEHLRADHREQPPKATRVADQLRQSFAVVHVYDYLFCLDYLQPQFELRWEGKALDQLSPGERGNLLLVFYLLIDKRGEPLIVDQPEENLDNQTISGMLVPCIKEAKERRQIIMVTHNPNLAVVCDADQIVYAQIDRTAGNKITYVTGAIENPEMTQLIVDVLEGTKPAFDKRGDTYGILSARP